MITVKTKKEEELKMAKYHGESEIGEIIGGIIGGIIDEIVIETVDDVFGELFD